MAIFNVYIIDVSQGKIIVWDFILWKSVNGEN